MPGGRALAEHVAERGHRRQLYLASVRSIVSAERRRSAFYEADRPHGLKVIEVAEPPWNAVLKTPVHAWTWAPAPERPSAVVCWSDTAAYALMACCRERGLRVPEDFAVAGFDSFSAYGDVTRNLTTVRAPCVEVDRGACPVDREHKQQVHGEGPTTAGASR